jgi:tellurite resistance protein TerC
MPSVITDHVAWSRWHRPRGPVRSAETFGKPSPRVPGGPLNTDALLWILLAVTIGTVLALDLLVFNRRAHAPSFREAAIFSAFYVALGLAFGAIVLVSRGVEDGSAYYAGYLLELSLSVDNVFVFALIFTAFVVPLKYQHRVLFYGILGAIVFRAIFIGLGAAIIETFHWAIYIFGVLLLYTGYRMWTQRNDHMIDPTKNPLLRLFRRFVPTTDGYREQRFIVLEHGRRMATPLLAVLLVVESSDILFAIDSVPAIFSVTTDTFLIFSSNAFAILGLRSLYFLLAGAVDKFRYLKPGLSALLIFAGLKILLADIVPIPIPLSLAVIVSILVVAIGASVIADRRDRQRGVTDGSLLVEGAEEITPTSG